MKTLRLISTFYKSYFIASSTTTIICIALLYKNDISIITFLIWFKFITFGLIAYYINSYKKKEFYYYQNLGLSKLFLWISTIIIDVLLFIIVMTFTLQIK